jgi:hypothetical protein
VDATSTPLEIDYRLTGVGWARCAIRFGEARCEISASYLTDALGKLVLGAVAVAAGAHSVSVGFDVEPGEYRWAIEEQPSMRVRVSILEFDELWSYLPDSQGQVMLSFECDPSDFAEAVRLAATRVRDAWPGAAYRERWHGHDFPARTLSLLEEKLGGASDSQA